MKTYRNPHGVVITADREWTLARLQAARDIMRTFKEENYPRDSHAYRAVATEIRAHEAQLALIDSWNEARES